MSRREPLVYLALLAAVVGGQPGVSEALTRAPLDPPPAIVRPRINADRVTATARPAVVQVIAYLDAPGLPRPLLVGQGAGVIFDSVAGHILTNHHVIADGDFFEVLLAEGDRLHATLIARDPSTDIAILSVAVADGLVAAPLGDSDRVQIGQEVVALGFAPAAPDPVAARSGSVVGIEGRFVSGARVYHGLIITDVPLLPGDSGGPLLDDEARVIGINTAVSSRRDGGETSYSIPINRVRAVIADLLGPEASAALAPAAQPT